MPLNAVKDLLTWELYIEHYYNYSFFFAYILVCIILVFILMFLAYRFTLKKKIDIMKNSPYECGFDPYDNAQKSLDIHFYIVGVLFLIFDLEVAFLFPWAVCLNSLGYFGFFIMIFFLFILTLGFIYEWSRGALDWADQYK